MFFLKSFMIKNKYTFDIWKQYDIFCLIFYFVTITTGKDIRKYPYIKNVADQMYNAFMSLSKEGKLITIPQLLEIITSKYNQQVF